ncbi:MAG: hydrogenase maturation nickel metallochaperone HypA [Candidatus Omnitrophota bacterium]|jgi:hydrogenase nickel incorporation protein HypA/HybF|nr:MAG: hydrogenase maturation nickel metallochaperone HypA [Candidatus Omnitrophota bacterium]
MHELAFAEEIFHCVEREARRHNAVKIRRVRLQVGQYSGVDPASLSFCLEAISAGTIMDGAAIEMMESRPEWICSTCGGFPGDSEALSACPNCGGALEYSAATDLRVQEIELDDDDNQT